MVIDFLKRFVEIYFILTVILETKKQNRDQALQLSTESAPICWLNNFNTLLMWIIFLKCQSTRQI